MARKVLPVTVAAEGRDKGKIFILTEMPASQGEKWALRALLAMSKSGVYIPEDIAAQGMAGVAVVGLRALGGIPEETALALMDEMFECVQIRPDPNKPEIVRPLVENDIEEIATRVKLRAEVFTLHTGFSFADAKSMFSSTPALADS